MSAAEHKVQTDVLGRTFVLVGGVMYCPECGTEFEADEVVKVCVQPGEARCKVTGLDGRQEVWFLN